MVTATKSPSPFSPSHVPPDFKSLPPTIPRAASRTCGGADGLDRDSSRFAATVSAPFSPMITARTHIAGIVIAMPLLLTFLLFQDLDETLRRLGDESVETRKEAAAALVKQGRSAIPLLRKILAKAVGTAKLEAESALSQISTNEVKALLDGAKIKRLGDLQIVTDDGLAALLPSVVVYLQITSRDDDDSGKRVIVVNDLADEKGRARLLAKETDIIPLFPMKAAKKEEAAAIARAALFLLRAMHPAAHSDRLIPGGSKGLKGEDVDWSLPDDYPLLQKEGAWRLDKVAMKLGHDYNHVAVSFDKEGRLTELKVTYTGVS